MLRCLRGDATHVPAGSAELASLAMKRATEEEPTARQRQRVAMTAEEALTAAEAEGLLLVRTDANASGFRHVTNSSGQRFRLKASGLPMAFFATAEEAALAYSRQVGREAAQAEAASPARAPRVDMTTEEALAAAEVLAAESDVDD